MKNVMWSVIPVAQIKETVWASLDDMKLNIDKEYLEKEFQKAQPAQAKAAGPAEKKVEVQKVSLIQPERSKNIEIVLSKLKMPYSTIS